MPTAQSHENRAALYVRASTEHQNYSTKHQEAALREYAASHQFDVSKIYRDEGRSGLTLDGRVGLLQLLSDVQSGKADFRAVLVYDVSRWGRFQDIDESAYYEYACRRSGIDVAYCAEPFANDGSPLATVLKSLKRAMAAEYSRELSSKVFRAQCRFTMAGYKQGGTAGYGLRRMAVSATGEARHVLKLGERKSAPTDRVVFIKGPDAETKVVERIYSMYIEDLLSDTQIADQLTSEGIPNEHGRPWSSFHVKNILTNEKYCGTLVFNRSTQRLKSSRRPNDPDKWVRLHNVFDALVTREQFVEANEERRRRRRQWTDDEMLDGLREILVEHGKVTADVINASHFPSAKSYAFRFNGLVAALDAAGVSGASLSRATITRFRVRCIGKDLSIELERCAALAGADIERLSLRTYRFNGVTVRLLCTRCRYERSHPCWKVTLRYDPSVDFVIWARMDCANERVEGIYLLPIADFPNHQYIWPSTRTLQKYEHLAHPSLPHLFGLSERTS